MSNKVSPRRACSKGCCVARAYELVAAAVMKSVVAGRFAGVGEGAWVGLVTKLQVAPRWTFDPFSGLVCPVSYGA